MEEMMNDLNSRLCVVEESLINITDDIENSKKLIDENTSMTEARFTEVSADLDGQRNALNGESANIISKLNECINVVNDLVPAYQELNTKVNTLMEYIPLLVQLKEERSEEVSDS